MSIRGVIFDLGSTLIHRTGLEIEREKCAHLAAYAVAELRCTNPEALAKRLLEIRLEGWRKAEESQIESLATQSIAQAFASEGLPTDDATLRRAEAVFFEPEIGVSRLYPGAREMLEALSRMGLRLGMISNASSHQLVLNLTRKHGIDAYFDPLVTSAGFGRTKPHPTIFSHVLDVWGIPAEKAVMVGDTLGVDILGAQGVGLRSILVDIEPNPDNSRFRDQVLPSARVTELEEILPLLRRWNGAR